MTRRAGQKMSNRVKGPAKTPLNDPDLALDGALYIIQEFRLHLADSPSSRSYALQVEQGLEDIKKDMAAEKLALKRMLSRTSD